MKIISHRGNISGPMVNRENNPNYIEYAIGKGYDVEVDVRLVDGELWLGHDKPQYRIERAWLNKLSKYLWIHCKDLEAARACHEYQAFCHSTDPYIYTSAGIIWVHNEFRPSSVDNMLILCAINKSNLEYLINTTTQEKPYGVCTDYPTLLESYI